jgi:membrane protease YdiL (CAAX protease family)
MSNVTSDIEPVPWNPWAAVLFVAAVYLGSQIVGGALAYVYPLFKHWSQAQATDWLNNSVGAQFVYILVAEAFTVGAIYLFLRIYRRGFAAIGLKRPRWSDPLYGLSAVPVYFALYLAAVAAVTYFVPSLNVNQQQQLGFNNVHGAAPMVMAFISLVVLPPLAEEIMVRGFLYGSLKKALPTIWAVIGTSAIFAAAHLPEGGAAGPLYIAAIDTFVLSLVLIYLRERTGSLWSSITLHAIKNGIAFAALFAFHAR